MSTSKYNLREQLIELGADRFASWIPVESLADFLGKGEKIHLLIDAINQAYPGILLCTEGRIIFAGKSKEAGVLIEQIPYHSLFSMEIKKGWVLSSSIIFRGTGKCMELNGCNHSAAKNFIRMVQELKNEMETRDRMINDLPG